MTTLEPLNVAIVELDALIAYVQTLNSDETEQLREQASELRKAITAHNTTRKLRAKAVQAETLCLRRLAQLGAIDHLSVYERAGANALKSLSDEDFELFLNQCVDVTNPSYSIHRFRSELSAARTEPHEFHPTDDVERWQENLRYFDRYDHINDQRWGGHPFTRDEVIDALNVILSCGEEHRVWTTDDLVAEAFAVANWEPYDLELCRKYVREFCTSGMPEWDGLPKFITFDTDGGWVRIPWKFATVEQARAMARLRRQQASDLLHKADEIDGAVDDLIAGYQRDHNAAPARETYLGQMASVDA